MSKPHTHGTLHSALGPVPKTADAPAARRPLSVRQQLILATYWFSLSFHAGALLSVAVPAQLLAFARDTDKTWLLGLLGGFSSLISMLVQPVAGALSDLSSNRWGRRRPYLVGGAALDVAGLAIMAVSASLSTLFAGFMLASFGNGVSGAAYQAYIPDQVPPEQHGEASGYMGAMMMLGTVGSFGAAGIMVAPGQAASFDIATAVIILAGAALTAVAIPDPATPPVKRPIAGSWRSLWLEPWRYSDFAWVFATRAMMMLALYTLFTFVAYYVRDVVHVTHFVQGAAVVAGAATLAALAGGLLTGLLSDRIGRKVIVSVASVLMSSALLALAFLHQLSVVLGLGVVFGLALGTYTAVDWALALDVLPDRGFAAKDLGLWSLSTGVPQTIAPFLGGGVLVGLARFGPATGYGALFLGAAVCAALSGVFVWRVKAVR